MVHKISRGKMSDLHLAAQTTKKYDLPLSHLDYSYVEKCSNVKELEKILKVLRSGEEGRFPDLEAFTEKRLEGLNPKSRALRKEKPISKSGDLSSGDLKELEQDLKDWSNNMHTRDNVNTNKAINVKNDLYEGEVDENLPPVRSSDIILDGTKVSKKKEDKSGKRTAPRDYRDWDKLNIDEELKKVDDTEANKTKPKRSSTKGITDKIDIAGLSEEEKERKANREKDKGNEAYRSGDYEESVTYFSRSIFLLPTSASYNNRALAYLKLEKWEKAIKDCNTVLDLEKNNVKALLRRGTAYKSKNQLRNGKADFEKVLELEPNNKKAEDLLATIEKELQKEVENRKEKGRRMVIEEVDDSEEGDEEEIEVEKPLVNGYGHHEKKNGEIKKLDEEKGDELKKFDSISVENTSVSSNTASNSKLILESKSPLGDGSGDTSSVTLTKDTKEMCSKSVFETKTASSFPVPDKDITGAFHKEATAQSTAALLSPQTSSMSSLSSSSSVSETSDEQTSVSDSQTNSIESPVSSSSSASTEKVKKSSSTAPDFGETSSFIRPVLFQLPLPEQVSKFKGEANNLFRSGQYSSALTLYSRAITILEKDSAQNVNTSLLLSNRAACHLKTGNCSDAISDCEKSLVLVPHLLKSILRRATAYESLEKYGQAYVDYKHVLSIDSSVDQAFQGASRCQRILTELYGQSSWRGKIPALVLVQPWEIPSIVDPSSQSVPPVSLVPSSTKGESSKSNTVPNDLTAMAEPKKSEESKQKKFEQLKASGNSHVQKGAYSEAEKCYSSCIELCPEQVACYTNRALCYIKLNKPTEAEADCDTALSLQSDNPKALYRRALARKMLQRYKLSMQDLLELLKLEPKNKAATSEMEIVKQYYKEELEQLKLKKQESDGKVRKRMKIEEVEEDEEEKHTKSKSQVKPQSKSRAGKTSQSPSVVKSKGANQSGLDKKQGGKDSSSSSSGQGTPVAPPIAPRLMKTTPYEFCQAWNSLKPNQGIQPYAEILRQVSPPDLPSVISNKLDGQMLQIIVRCVYEEMVLKGEMDKGYQILDNLCKVPRFSTVSMFMSSKEKKEVSSVLDILSKTVSNAYSKADVLHLKKEYSVK